MLSGITVALVLSHGVLSMRRKSARSRVHSNASRVSPYSDEYPTVEGCQCNAGQVCEADIGTGWTCSTCRTSGCGNWAVGYRWDYCDFRPSTVPEFIAQSWESKQSYFWDKIIANTTFNADYSLLSLPFTDVRFSFDNYRPEMPTGRPKIIHAGGSVCQFKLDVNLASPYSGILSPGSRSGIIRMGSAADLGRGITPGVGIKFGRSGVHDADMVFINSLSTGDGWNFFKDSMANHIPTASGLMLLLVNKFKDASQCPYQVGCSDMARYAQDGTETYPPVFPFKIAIVVNPELSTGNQGEDLDSIHAELDAIPVGTTLYTMYACAEPSGDEMDPGGGLEKCGAPVLLGDIVTTSQCTTSAYGDEYLHFRHQRIEEDWALQPGFMSWGDYTATAACAESSLSVDGAPEICGLEAEGMLASDV